MAPVRFYDLWQFRHMKLSELRIESLFCAAQIVNRLS